MTSYKRRCGVMTSHRRSYDVTLAQFAHWEYFVFFIRNWNQEPNDYKGAEDCALIYNTGEYNDMSCEAHAPAICELDNQGKLTPSKIKTENKIISDRIIFPYNKVLNDKNIIVIAVA